MTTVIADRRSPQDIEQLVADRLASVIARSIKPRKPVQCSEWSDEHMKLSQKGNSKPGDWVTANNPPLREPMDNQSASSPVRETVLMFPIQFGKSAVATNAVGYWMDYDPGPIMYALPGEVSMGKWINQKLTPMIEVCAPVRRVLSSTATRDSRNQRDFKDFEGGQLYVEHAGSPQRLKSTSVQKLVVDELDEVAHSLRTGDDPLKMLDGRTSSFPSTYKRLYISTPTIEGLSRIKKKYLQSDQRRYYVPCPHCDHMQPLEWSGLHWSPDASDVWYSCRSCMGRIDEYHKTAMIAAGTWIAENPESEIRGYTINCLYYQFDLGPRWSALVKEWLEAQGDPAALKTFLNDRLAETWEDPAMRKVKHNIIADRVEPYRLRTAVHEVLAITCGVDTQDNRLAVQIVGWGRGMRSWTLDYVELPGDPAEDAVWDNLVDLLNRPIERVDGGLMQIMATAIDAGGHRTEDVKNFVRSRRIRRPLCIFGAVPNNAPILSKGKLEDVNHRGKLDKRGVLIQHVGTVAAKHALYSRLSVDADKPVDARLLHFSDELPQEFFRGLVAEVYNPAKNRFEKKYARNEPLDTYIYAYAAAHHAEVRLHRYSKADWDALELRVVGVLKRIAADSRETPTPETAPTAVAKPLADSRETPRPKKARRAVYVG